MVQPDFKKSGGLVPAVVQDVETKEVLMLAYMNELSWQHTLQTGKATYWSRSRNELWVKGETSGNVQWVREIRIDCDNDTILLMVEQNNLNIREVRTGPLREQTAAVEIFTVFPETP